MKTEGWKLAEAVEYYRGQGAPGEQQALVALLREVQEESGGVLPRAALAEIAGAYRISENFLAAVVKRIPSLRTEVAPHRLEVCGGRACGGKGARALADWVERTYAVQSGGASAKGGFTYRVAGCMKRCGKGPNVKWDGTVYSGADEALLRALIERHVQ